ncbi:MAG: F0F1 ATP synthase subunit gamma [Kiritimatiellaeota bacterium]|nr:F0F1 ATP synthase subunit gamma [Kiritimatiellota bacterium]
MPTLKEYNTRLATMNGMRRVTSTMQMVAASHLHRMQREMTFPVAFGATLSSVLQVAQHIPLFAKHRFMGGGGGGTRLPPRNNVSGAEAPRPQILLIVMASDRGLCGAFNHGIAVSTHQWVEKQREQRHADIEPLYVGKKGAGLLSRDLPSPSPVLTLSVHPKISEMMPVADMLVQRFLNEDVDEVWISGNRFVNTLKHDSMIMQVLPFTGQTKPGKVLPPPLLEPADERLVDALMRQWVHYCLLMSQQHRVACEHASRVVAMTSATDNLKTMERDLKLRRNRARQTAITNELMEIIAGAEALN